MMMHQLAKELGITTTAIRYRSSALCLKASASYPLDSFQIEKIRNFKSRTKYSIRSIAKRYGVSNIWLGKLIKRVGVGLEEYEKIEQVATLYATGFYTPKGIEYMLKKYLPPDPQSL